MMMGTGPDKIEQPHSLKMIKTVLQRIIRQ